MDTLQIVWRFCNELSPCGGIPLRQGGHAGNDGADAVLVSGTSSVEVQILRV
jgi:hypothetical protein